jgi:flagellar FliJ protein
MKKFKFRFETVLKVKEKKEEQLKREFMQLIALKIRQENLLMEIEKEKQEKAKEKFNEKQIGTDIQTLIFYEEYTNLLRKQIEETEKRIKELQEKADIKREELIEASKQKKIFERLKQSDFNEFKNLVLKNEQQLLDEIAVNKFNRGEQKSY